MNFKQQWRENKCKIIGNITGIIVFILLALLYLYLYSTITNGAISGAEPSKWHMLPMITGHMIPLIVLFDLGGPDSWGFSAITLVVLITILLPVTYWYIGGKIGAAIGRKIQSKK
ncbi:MAG: hypothetical protein WC457_03505 [Patescibacteria group bacterium]